MYSAENNIPPFKGNGRRGRSHSASTNNYSKPKYDGSMPPPFGAGWNADTSANASFNSSFNGDRNIGRGNRTFDHVSSDRRRHGSNHSFNESFDQNFVSKKPFHGLRADAKKTFHGGNRRNRANSQSDSMFLENTSFDSRQGGSYQNWSANQNKSRKGPPRFGDGWNANKSSHGEYGRGRSFSHDDSSFRKETKVKPFNDGQRGASEKWNSDYQKANKSFHQLPMDRRGRARSDSDAQQYWDPQQSRVFNTFAGNGAAKHHKEECRDRNYFRGETVHSTRGFQDFQNFKKGSNTNRFEIPPRKAHIDATCEYQTRNYSHAVHNSVPFDSNNSYRGSANNVTYHSEDSQMCDERKRLPKAHSTSHKKGFKKQYDQLDASFKKNSTDRVEGQDTQSQQGQHSKLRRWKASTNILSGADWDANSTFHENRESGCSQDEAFIAEPANESFMDSHSSKTESFAAYRDANSSLLSEEGDLNFTGLYDTSYCAGDDSLDDLTTSLMEMDLSNRSFGSHSFNNKAEKKKITRKNRSELNRTFAGFELDGPSPIAEVNEEEYTPILAKARADVTPLRNKLNLNSKKILLSEETETLGDIPLEADVKIQSPDPREREDSVKIDENVLDTSSDGSVEECPLSDESVDKFSKSMPDVYRINITEEIEDTRKQLNLKHFKSVNVLFPDTQTSLPTRRTPTIRERFTRGHDGWNSYLPFKGMVYDTPLPNWRHWTAIEKSALLIDFDTDNFVGRYIAHNGFTKEMPIISVIFNHMFYFNAKAKRVVMPLEFEFDLIPTVECPIGDLVPGMYAFLDKNNEEFAEVYDDVARMTRVVNKVPPKDCKKNIPWDMLKALQEQFASVEDSEQEDAEQEDSDQKNTDKMDSQSTN